MHVAVALCTHQGERFLDEQLDSIARQTRPPDEVVIGDDCSTDGTADAVRRFAASVPYPVRFLTATERLGTARNFQRVIAACTSGPDLGGDDGNGSGIIVLADHDDAWHPDRLAALEAAFMGPSRPGMVFSDGDLIDGRSEPVPGSCWGLVRLSPADATRLASDDGFALLLDRQLSLGGTVTGATMALRAEHRALVLPFPDWLPRSGKAAVIHDAWIALLIAAVAPVEAVPQQLVHYRIHDGQQVGLQARPPVSRLRMTGVALRSLRQSAGDGPRLKAAEAQWLRSLLERLQAAPATAQPGSRAAASRDLLEGRLAHFTVRGELPARRLRRVRPILAELATGRYQRYSRGAMSAARDFLEP